MPRDAAIAADPARQRKRALAAERMRRSRRRLDEGRACSLVDFGSDTFDALEIAGLWSDADAENPAALRVALSEFVAQATRHALEEETLLRVTRDRLDLHYHGRK